VRLASRHGVVVGGAAAVVAFEGDRGELYRDSLCRNCDNAKERLRIKGGCVCREEHAGWCCRRCRTTALPRMAEANDGDLMQAEAEALLHVIYPLGHACQHTVTSTQMLFDNVSNCADWPRCSFFQAFDALHGAQVDDLARSLSSLGRQMTVEEVEEAVDCVRADLDLWPEPARFAALRHACLCTTSACHFDVCPKAKEVIKAMRSHVAQCCLRSASQASECAQCDSWRALQRTAPTDADPHAPPSEEVASMQPLLDSPLLYEITGSEPSKVLDGDDDGAHSNTLGKGVNFDTLLCVCRGILSNHACRQLPALTFHGAASPGQCTCRSSPSPAALLNAGTPCRTATSSSYRRGSTPRASVQK
jgi:hypothetical protein